MATAAYFSLVPTAPQSATTGVKSSSTSKPVTGQTQSTVQASSGKGAVADAQASDFEAAFQKQLTQQQDEQSRVMDGAVSFEQAQYAASFLWSEWQLNGQKFSDTENLERQLMPYFQAMSDSNFASGDATESPLLYADMATTAPLPEDALKQLQTWMQNNPVASDTLHPSQINPEVLRQQENPLVQQRAVADSVQWQATEKQQALSPYILDTDSKGQKLVQTLASDQQPVEIETVVDPNTLSEEGQLDIEQFSKLELRQPSISQSSEPIQTLTQNQPHSPVTISDASSDQMQMEMDIANQSLVTKNQTNEKSDVRLFQSSAQANDIHSVKLDTAQQDPRWNEKIAERISLMVRDTVQEARIQLDPPELGALEIRVKVQNDQVTVTFNTGNQQVRDALDMQSPRLRELLEQQGLDLKGVNVSDQGQQQSGAGGFAGHDQGEGLEAESWDFSEESGSQPSTQISMDNLVDYFA